MILPLYLALCVQYQARQYKIYLLFQYYLFIYLLCQTQEQAS